MNISLNDDLEEDFRNAISAKFGLKKGVINKAICEAVKDWIEKNKPPEK